MQAGFIGVTQVDGEHRLARNHVDHIGLEGNAAGGGQGAPGLASEGASLGHSGARHVAGVMAQSGRRSAGMVGIALHRHLLPGNALEVFHHADLDALGLEDRALLNMQLEHGMHFS